MIYMKIERKLLKLYTAFTPLQNIILKIKYLVSDKYYTKHSRSILRFVSLPKDAVSCLRKDFQSSPYPYKHKKRHWTTKQCKFKYLNF